MSVLGCCILPSLIKDWCLYYINVDIPVSTYVTCTKKRSQNLASFTSGLMLSVLGGDILSGWLCLSAHQKQLLSVLWVKITILRYVTLYNLVSRYWCAFSIFRIIVVLYPEDCGSGFLLHVGSQLLNNKAVHLKRLIFILVAMRTSDLSYERVLKSITINLTLVIACSSSTFWFPDGTNNDDFYN